TISERNKAVKSPKPNQKQTNHQQQPQQSSPVSGKILKLQKVKYKQPVPTRRGKTGPVTTTSTNTVNMTMHLHHTSDTQS
ncbi:hypothetical protein NUI01_06570, partial [Corynebacterium sp. MC-17D]|uniref:hypothetical protein n=1 Tax=Corynebacterium lipophilum TaxID=2804918 RepID=UPI0022A920E8